MRYWEEPWDFLCFWAFLTDFLVNPSTFSDAEMADILMQKLSKTSDRRMYPRSNETFPFLFLLFALTQKYGARLLSKSYVILMDHTWSLGIRVSLSPKTASLGQLVL